MVDSACFPLFLVELVPGLGSACCRFRFGAGSALSESFALFLVDLGGFEKVTGVSTTGFLGVGVSPSGPSLLRKTAFSWVTGASRVASDCVVIDEGGCVWFGGDND